jgi:methylmalonyl-CoA/ethylmalonyl-CoA epimerase
MSASQNIFQICFVVPDIAAAMPQWQKTMGCGPFYMMEGVEPQNPRYRGAPSFLKMHAAMAQAGDIQVELIQPLSAEPNVYRDSVPAGATAFHHVAYWSNDYDAELRHFAAIGAAVVSEASYGSMRLGYFDTRARIGCMTEVLEHDEGVKALFEQIRVAAIGWDGSDPVRKV